MGQRDAWIGVLATVGLQLLGAEVGSAVAALNCQTAADCGGPPATCELTTYQTCAGKDPACPAGSSCGEKPTLPSQPDCAPYVEGICRHPYELPCQVDADCGVGFRCIEQIGMACAGMGSSGSAGVAPESHEVCHVSRGTFACELNRTRCTLDSDCAAGLRCQQSDANLCFEITCNVDASCATGLRCTQNTVSFCWTSLTSPRDPAAALALDECTKSPPVLCAPRGYFVAQEVNTSDGGVASSVDDSVTATGANATNAPPALSDAAAGAPDAGERSAPAGADGCSLRGRTRAARTDLSWVALLGMFLVRRRRPEEPS